MKKDVTVLYCFVDDFIKVVDEYLQKTSIEKIVVKVTAESQQEHAVSIAEILTIILMYYRSPCKNFEYFYNLLILPC